MNTTKFSQFMGAAVLFAISFSSCKKPIGPNEVFVSNDIVMYWNAKAVAVVNAPITPPSQSRFIAMVQISVHDALNSIKPKFETIALHNVLETNASPDAAVASAAYWTLKNMNIRSASQSFAWSLLDSLDTWYAESLGTIPDGESKDLGIALGKKSSDAIIAKRSTDNFAVANRQMALPDGVAPGEYRSTLPFSNTGMPKIKALDQWGTVMTPFVIKTNSQFRPAPPLPVSSPEYVTEYNEVKAKGARTGHTRTDDEDQIGVFWVERSTLGWNRFARNIINAKNIDAWRTARLFALLHTAMTDAATASFEAKYYYLYWRPETAIRLGDTDGNPNTAGDATWLPSYTETPNPGNSALNINTPPIPDYPSIHAGFGGAGAEILKLFFQTDIVSIDQTSTTKPGIIRHYSSISQAAKENSLSRIYVGYHFRNSVVKGEEQGTQVGNYVFNNSFLEIK